MIAMPAGTISAPAAPCKTRPITRSKSVGAIPQNSEATANRIAPTSRRQSQVVNAARFSYLGTDAFKVHFAGFGTEPSADFAGGTLLNGSVLQFKIQSGNSVPDTSSPWILLLLGLSITLAFRHILEHSGYRQRRE